MIYVSTQNLITAQYKELLEYKNLEFIDLYESVTDEKLKVVFSTLHGNLVSLFKLMNERLPTLTESAHFWADPSRDLIKIIDILRTLHRGLKITPYSFSIDPYYETIITECEGFLSHSLGSRIPPSMNKVALYYEMPIFEINTSLQITRDNDEITCVNMKKIGEGSYADVFRYKDPHYNKHFVLKRARKDLDAKELRRFQQEFDQMSEFDCPYILEVYRYDHEKFEYTMESMDYTLNDYILKNNNKLTFRERKSICSQILKAFSYIHFKGCLHRDISPKNVLLKQYDQIVVVKVADFGLVKVPNSQETSNNSEMKGYFNDQSLQLDGFKNYNILHETYALTRLILFVFTGKLNLEGIKDSKLIEFKNKGLNPDKNKRFKSVDEIQAFISSMSMQPI